MNYLVTSYMRTGSTMVLKLLKLLLDETDNGFVQTAIDYHPSEEELLSLVGETKVTKSHTILPASLRFLAMEDKLGVIGIRRPFLDCLVSLLLYNAKCRTTDGLDIPVEYQKAIDSFGMLDDEAFVNMFIDTQFDFVIEEARRWLMFDRSYVCKNMHIFNYDRVFSVSPKELAFVISEKMSITLDPKILETLNKKMLFTPGGATKHARQGHPGEGERMIDSKYKKLISNFIKAERQKRPL